MKKYLVDLFNYTDWANRTLLAVVLQLPDPGEAQRLFSHFISSQDKWMNRISGEREDREYAWFGEIFPLEELESRWGKSIEKWYALIDKLEEKDLDGDVFFQRPSDGQKMSVKLRDIMLQMNYHGIHHRAQVNTMIRQQGLVPPPTDYILTVLKEV